MVKFLTLGTSSTFPFPRTVTNQMEDYRDIGSYDKKFELHNDIVCNLAKKGGKERRTRSCMAILTADGTILIDAGPDILFQLKKHTISPDAVFITHDHSDANFGVKYLKNAEILAESLGNIKPGKEIKIFGIKIIPFRVQHALNVKTFGFKILTGNKKIAYISDIANLKGVKKWIFDTDIIFADGSNLSQNLPTHMSIISQLKSYKRWGIKKIFFTHIGHKTLPHPALVKYVKSIYKNSDIAYDGMQIKG